MLHEDRGAVTGDGEDPSPGDAVVCQDVTVFRRDVVRLDGVAQLYDVLLLRQKELMECARGHSGGGRVAGDEGTDPSQGDAVLGQDVTVFCRDVVRLAQLYHVLLLRQNRMCTRTGGRR